MNDKETEMPETTTPPAAVPAPIDMVLYCPDCGQQHIDAPEVHDVDWGNTITQSVSWTNPPHRSHLCHGCGHIWRPADVPTNGVAAVKTKGKADSPIAAPQQDEREALVDVLRNEQNNLAASRGQCDSFEGARWDSLQRVIDYLSSAQQAQADAMAVDCEPVKWQARDEAGWFDIPASRVEKFRQDFLEVRALYAHPSPAGESDAIALLKRLKRDLMHTRRFGSDTLQAFKSACSQAEGDIEEWLNEYRAAMSREQQSKDQS